MGLASSVVTLGTFIIQVVPGVVAATLSLVLSAVAALVLIWIVRQRRFLGRSLDSGQVKLARAFLVVLLALSLGLIWRVASEPGRQPLVTTAAAADRSNPYPEHIVAYDDPYSYAAHATTRTSDGGVSVRYYLVSDRTFWGTLFDGKLIEGLDMPQSSLLSEGTTDSDRRLLVQLADPESSVVVKTEPLEFARYLWNTYLRDRRPVGRLNLGFTDIKGKVAVDARFKRDKIDDYEDVVWFRGTNTQFLENGWLDLDPLSKAIVQASPNLTAPVVKAGAVRWDTSGGCGDAERQVFEYAFVVPRSVQLVFADVENQSSSQVHEVSLSLSSANPIDKSMFQIRDDAATSKLFSSAKTVVYKVPGGIPPGDHALVPIGVRLSDYASSPDYDPTDVRALGFFGPAVRVDSMSVGQERPAPVRGLDERNLTFVCVGGEAGSCPSLMTWSPNEERWIKDQNILIGARSVERKRVERHGLRRFNGQLQIREMDDETSFIDMAYVEATDPSGHVVRLAPDTDRLDTLDARCLTLETGASITVDFPDWLEGLTDPTLVIGGYYQPNPGARPERP